LETKVKTHPNGLPHLNAAVKPGGVDHAEILAGAKAWSEAIQRGEYEIVHAYEFAVSGRDDVLVIHRRKK
jgi:hypothetical protein